MKYVSHTTYVDFCFILYVLAVSNSVARVRVSRRFIQAYDTPEAGVEARFDNI